jgi:transcriptional regulator with XRE-family HTH domain
MTQSGTTQQWTTALDGQRIRQLRREHGLSQQDLAGRAGISRTTVARLEHQPARHTAGRTLARLTAALAAVQPPPSAEGHATAGQSSRHLIAACELLARTAELPTDKSELLAVLSEYRVALFNLAIEDDGQRHSGAALPSSVLTRSPAP